MEMEVCIVYVNEIISCFLVLQKINKDHPSIVLFSCNVIPIMITFQSFEIHIIYI